MKEKRTGKKYISILLDSNELIDRKKVKSANKISDRKIYMAMIKALLPVETTAERVEETSETTTEETTPEITPEVIEEE